jgi:hypothetical protein
MSVSGNILDFLSYAATSSQARVTTKLLNVGADLG